MNSAIKIHEEVIKNANTDSNIRSISEFKIGLLGRQGDIYIHGVKNGQEFSLSFPDQNISVNVDDFNIPSTNTQLVSGSTKGSRHVVAGNVKIFRAFNDNPLISCLLEVKDKATITHPSHAHFQLPSGKYMITQQRDYAVEELKAVRD